MNKQQQNNDVGATGTGGDTWMIDYINAQLRIMKDINADSSAFKFENDMFRFTIEIKRKDDGI